MRRIAYVARIKHDKETTLRYFLDKAVPTVALKQVGIHGLDAFIGSGYCVMVFDYDGDFQEVLGRMIENDDIAEFREKMSGVLDNFPAPGEEPESSELPLAGEAYVWSPEPTQAI